MKGWLPPQLALDDCKVLVCEMALTRTFHSTKIDRATVGIAWGNGL